MKKFLCIIIPLLFLLSGCSYDNFVSPCTTNPISYDVINYQNNENIDFLFNSIKIEESNNSKYNRNEWTSTYQKYNCKKGHDHNSNSYKYDDNGIFKSIRAYSYFESKWYNWDSDTYIDPYTGDIIDDISKTDYDHIIPLAYVNAHGGSEWSEKEKKDFADNTSVGVCTNSFSNRQKGANGPSKWLPDINKEAYCYSWLVIANDFNITLDQEDYDKISEILNGFDSFKLETIN